MVMSKSVDSHLELAQRLLANVDADTSDLAAAPMKVPASAYRDPARWQLEMEHVFRRSPLVVALSCDIANPGDYSATEIAGRPIVVMRGDDGVARTFLNICRHRGAAVFEEGAVTAAGSPARTTPGPTTPTGGSWAFPGGRRSATSTSSG